MQLNKDQMIGVRLDSETHRLLKVICAEQKITRQEIVSELITAFIEASLNLQE